MKGLLLGAALTLGLGQMAFATTTDSLRLTTAGLTATIGDNGSCVGTGCGALLGDLNPLAGTDTVAGTIGGWTVSIVSGTSHSPILTPFGLDLTSLTAACTATCTGAGELHVIFSDTDFNIPVAAGGFLTTYSNTQSGTGTTSESAYFDNGNGLFAETTLIGTVGPFTGSDHGSASGGPIPAVPNYSLTLDEVFSSVGPASFSVDGNVTATPEPSAILLLGTLLIGVTQRLRRRDVKA